MGGSVVAEGLIPEKEGDPAKGLFVGVFAGAFMGGVTGATTGALSFVGAPRDYPLSHPVFGAVVGGIAGAFLGGIYGGLGGASINEAFSEKGVRSNVVRKRLPSGKMGFLVESTDSVLRRRILIEAPKPPLKVNKIRNELIVGALSAYCIGGLSELAFDGNDFMWGVSGLIAGAIGVCKVGTRDNETGSLAGTLFMGAGGMFLSHRLWGNREYIDGRENRGLFLGLSPIVTAIGLTLAFNMTRSYVDYQNVETGFLNLKDSRIIIGNPSMYVHSDPFGNKEVAYGFELFKFKF